MLNLLCRSFREFWTPVTSCSVLCLPPIFCNIRHGNIRFPSPCATTIHLLCSFGCLVCMVWGKGRPIHCFRPPVWTGVLSCHDRESRAFILLIGRPGSHSWRYIGSHLNMFPFGRKNRNAYTDIPIGLTSNLLLESSTTTAWNSENFCCKSIVNSENFCCKSIR